MKTKGAYLLLSTALVASCFAAPAFAADDAKVPEGAPDVSKEPAEPSKEEQKDIGKKKRGIIISEIKAPSKTAEPKPEAQATKSTVNRSVKIGKDVFTRGLVIEQPKNVTKTATTTTTTTKQQPIATKKSTSTPPIATTTKKSVTPIAIQKSTTTPLQVKTVTPQTQTAKAPVKKIEVVATKSSPIKQVSNNESNEQIVTAWLNKTGNKPHYKDGEHLQVNVSANKDCNLMIFNYDGEQLTQLYPNEYQSSPFVKAGSTVEVGGKGFKFDFTVAANPAGKASTEKIFVYAYPLESDSSPISIAMAPVPSSPFRAAEMTPEQYRDMINKSEVFFGRRVKVTKKVDAVEEVELASFEQQSSAAPNKIELQLVVDPNKR